MALTFTREQILALAPDAQVSQAGQTLGQPVKWRTVGQDDSTAWGYHQGSGSAPYRVAVDTSGPAFKCSCPSRKQPCKHALGLFLLVTSHPHVISETSRPDWVQEWVVGRAKVAERAESAAKVQKAAATAANATATEAARTEAGAGKRTGRQAQREKRVQEGAVALSRWLEDLVRQGTGSAQQQPSSFWGNQAARLVDAQAPGLSRRVAELAAVPGSGEGWPARMLHQVAQLHLLLEAYGRLKALPGDLQAEIRSQIGWTQDQDALRSEEGTRDRWLVIGRRITAEDRLRVQRTWLWGARTQAAALVLDFAPPRRPFTSTLTPGTAVDAEVVFWPGAGPQRALVKTQHEAGQIEALPGYGAIDDGLAAWGAAAAANPWLDRFLMPLSACAPARHGKEWMLYDGQGACLPLHIADIDGWRLLALSGGEPITVAGEWNGEWMDPLSAWVAAGVSSGRLHLLGDVGNGK